MVDADQKRLEECRRIIARHSKSFSLASGLLSSRVRDDAVVVYAWCRRCDDAIDHAPVRSLNDAMISLRAEADAIFAGGALSDSVVSAFQEVVQRRAIPRYYVDELLCGMEMDADGVWAPSLDGLRRYCFRVAGVVGLMMCRVMGVGDPRALPHAVHLGMGMQMTNIARDVHEDWQRGRLYLPETWLREANAYPRPDASLTAEIAERLKPVVARLLKWAELHYASGRQGLRYLDARSAWAVGTAAAVYRQIGVTIQKNGFDPLAERAVTTKKKKVALALGELVRTRIRRVFGFEREKRSDAAHAAILRFEETPVLETPGP